MTQSPEPATSASRLRQELIDGSYVRNAWYVAAWSDDVSDGKLVPAPSWTSPSCSIARPMALLRRSRTAVRTASRRCTWARSSAAIGSSAPITAWYDHTGACVLNPHGAKTIPTRARVQSYPVIEQHKAIWNWMGGAAADAAMVPDFGVLDNVPELHTTKRDNIVIRANYQLIIDNLLDLSHTSYLHDGSLGNQDTVESEITVEQDGDDVVVGRHATNSVPPGMFAQFWPNDPPRVDRFTRMRWMAPSTMRLVTGILRKGAQQESGTGYHAIHMLTPESERSTHYFFTAVRFGVMTTDEKAQPRPAGEGREDAALRVRGAGRAGDRGAATDHRDCDETARSRDPRHRCRAGALQAHPRQDAGRRAAVTDAIPGRSRRWASLAPQPILRCPTDRRS